MVRAWPTGIDRLVFISARSFGARTSDLPIQQPTKFDLVLNLKTAKALGLTVPRSNRLRCMSVVDQTRSFRDVRFASDHERNADLGGTSH
jgi:hypothetical protein